VRAAVYLPGKALLVAAGIVAAGAVLGLLGALIANEGSAATGIAYAIIALGLCATVIGAFTRATLHQSRLPVAIGGMLASIGGLALLIYVER
jgi:hypothetical protein